MIEKCAKLETEFAGLVDELVRLGYRSPMDATHMKSRYADQMEVISKLLENAPQQESEKDDERDGHEDNDNDRKRGQVSDGATRNKTGSDDDEA